MALNVIFSDVESERRAVTVGSNVAPGTPLIQGTRPAVTITGSGDYAGNQITLSGQGESLVLSGGRGGVSLDDTEATVTYTGTFAFDVEGATAATTGGTPVYIEDGELTLTAAEEGAVKFGVVEFYRGELSATDTAVTIGVNLG